MDMLYRQLPVIAQTSSQFMEISVLITAIDHRLNFSEQIAQSNLFSAIANLNSQLQGTSISMQLPYAHRSLRDYYELRQEHMMDKLASSFGLLLKSQYDIVALELRSGFLYEQNLLTEALKIALQTKNAINDETRDEVIFCSFIHLASIYYAMGLERMFEGVVEQTDQYIEQNGSYYLRPNFMAFKTKMRLMDGDKAAAKIWLNNYFVTENETLELYKIFQHFTTTRAYIVLSQTDKAMSYILKLKKLGTDFHRPLDIAEASVLQAVLEWALGNKKEALHTLETALVTMQEFGFLRVFADEGASVLPILKKLALNLQKENRQTPLTAKFLNEVIIAAYEQSKRHKGIAANINCPQTVKLSKQQKHIVTLLSKGYKNAEIAELTGLTIHTVKSHCAAAYAKLSVNSAMDAVLRAKELGLIADV